MVEMAQRKPLQGSAGLVRRGPAGPVAAGAAGQQAAVGQGQQALGETKLAVEVNRKRT